MTAFVICVGSSLLSKTVDVTVLYGATCFFVVVVVHVHYF